MKKKINWKPYLISGIISIIIGTTIFLISYLKTKNKYGAINGTSIASIVLICLAGLMYVSRQGFFDLASYGFKQMGVMIFSNNPNSLNDYPTYKNIRNEERKTSSHYYLSFLFVGLLFLIAYFIIKIN